MDPIIIIGTGLAGYTLAREFRKLDKSTPLMLITADHGGFYSKPMISSALASNKSAEELITATAEQMAKQLHAEIITHSKVSSIDAPGQSVSFATQTRRFSKLALALGAQQRDLNLSGDGAASVMTVNNVDDYGRFRAALQGAHNVAIVGAGLIGCEFSNDLLRAGLNVHLISHSDLPLDRLAPPPIGAALKAALVQEGLHWYGGTTATSIHQAGRKLRVTLGNGADVAADVVFAATGLVPKTDLAARAAILINQGIVADRCLNTSDANIFALGDCAEINGTLMPYVMPLMNQARALAKTLAGEPTAVVYPIMPIVVKTPSYPIVVAPPAPGSQGVWKHEAMPGGIRSLYVGANGSLLGFALGGAAITEKTALSKTMPEQVL